jgi:hypothetical protein
MHQTVPLGKIARIPAGASWSAIVTLAVIVDLLATGALPAGVPRPPPALYWGIGVAAAVAFLASLLAHELPCAGGPPGRHQDSLRHAVDARRRHGA